MPNLPAIPAPGCRPGAVLHHPPARRQLWPSWVTFPHRAAGTPAACPSSPRGGAGQPDDDARANDAATFVAPVLGTDAPLQRLDDLPADRQPEAGMLAEMLALRPLGIE